MPPLNLPGASREHRRAGLRTSSAATSGPSRVRLVLVPLAAAAALAIGPQYDRGSKLNWTVQGREIPVEARCMAARGYHFPRSHGPFDQAEFADNTQWPDLPRIAKSHEFVPAAGLSGSSIRYSHAEQAAANTCWMKAERPYHALLAIGRTLSTEWLARITPIQASAPVMARIPGLTACATRYGFPSDPYGPPAGPIRTFTDFADWVFGHLDGAGSRAASQARMSTLNRHWTKVFVACATPIVTTIQRLQLTAQARFLTGHAAQVRRLDRLAWRILGPHHR